MAFLIRVVVSASLLVSCLWGQAQDVVFQSAYERSFAVLGCSNTNPIVVTIQAPASNEALAYLPLDAGSLVTIRGVEGNTACNVQENAITVLTPTTFELVGVNGNGAYFRGGVGTSDTLSTGLPSPVLANVGQVGHLFSVEFPTAPSPAPVGPLQVRLEAADQCPDPPFCALGDWRPISVDVTTVIEVAQVAYYQIRFSNGAWRALRINSILNTPADLPMRVDYTGMPIAVGSVTETNNFFIINPPGSSYPDGGLEFVAGACQNGSASLAFNGGTLLPLPEAQCLEDDQELAVAAFDDTTSEYVQDGFLLAPQGTPSLMTVTVEWTAAGTGTAQFALEYACLGPGMALGSVNWSTAQTVVGEVLAAGSLSRTVMQADTPGCLASEFFFWQFSRTGGQGTLSGDALVKSILFLPSQ